MGHRNKAYFYSALSSLFFFVILRQLGFLEQRRDRISLVGDESTTFLRSSSSSNSWFIAGEIRARGMNSRKAASDYRHKNEGFTTSFASVTNRIANGATEGAPTETMFFNASSSSVNASSPREPVPTATTTTTTTTASTTTTIPVAAGNTAANLQNQPMAMEKPPVYTFFTGVHDRAANTGMNTESDNHLLQTWKQEWALSGWNPVVLTLETAKQHPDFQKISALLDGPFGEYDRYCFLRWLAVAVAGGGFAVDYDTFPLNFVMPTLPNGGKLTVHENSKAGGVPSVVSGSAEEYTRFAWALARNVGEHKMEAHWSDMKAMQDMYQKTNGTAYIMNGNVLSAIVVLNGRGYDARNCARVAEKYALHFSHYAIRYGKLREGVGPQDRAGIGSEWLRGWREHCKRGMLNPSLLSSTTTTSSVVVPNAASANMAKPIVATSVATVQQNQPQTELVKPPIYTFFTSVQDKTKRTGMNDAADHQLLQTWKQEWSRAGWNPVVLTLEMAKQHPDFQAINALLLLGPFGEYDRFCFLRWLAVAAVGGGFAVDYDTFPLDFVMTTLPNGGKLTVHENSRAGGVPSLVSANAGEYTAFAWALAMNLGAHKTEAHWSDMKAMQDMYQKSNGTAYIMESNVLSALVVLNERGFDDHNCGIVAGKYALHFSHHAIQYGKLRQGAGPQDRASVGSEWLQGWRESCKRKNPAQGKASSWFSAAKSALLPNAAIANERNAVSSVQQIQQTALNLRPPVYTFFTGVQDRTKSTGMNADADNLLLEAWKLEWSRAGWNPVVLTLETAKQHPDFQKISVLLDGPFGEYDRYCFLRWLALAVAGGGFAADYDAFPLAFLATTLPNGGKLTVHEHSRAGGVPSLVSANAAEYTAFAWALARNLGEHKTEAHWSDMKAMQDMYQKTNGTAYIMESNVLSALVVLNGRGFDDFNCRIITGKYALHFSHHAIQYGKLWEGVGPKDRAAIGREWLKGWQASCKKKS